MYDPELHVRAGEAHFSSRKTCHSRGFLGYFTGISTSGLEKGRLCRSIGLVGAREGGAEPLVVFWEEVFPIKIAVLGRGAGRRGRSPAQETLKFTR